MIGWIACGTSFLVTLSQFPVVMKARERGHLLEENVSPWVACFLAAAVCTLYVFHRDSPDARATPLGVWCFLDAPVSAFYALSATRLTPIEHFDQIEFLLLVFFFVTMALLAAGSRYAVGMFMLLIGVWNSASVVTNLASVAKTRRSVGAIDPFMMPMRFVSGLAWTIHFMLPESPDIFLVLQAGLFAMFAFVSLVFYIVFHPCCCGLPVVEHGKKTKEEEEEEAAKCAAKLEMGVMPSMGSGVPMIAAAPDDEGSGGVVDRLNLQVADQDAERHHHRERHHHLFERTLGVSSGGTLECAVCIRETSGEKVISLRCGHRFCAGCLQKCSDSELKTCPVCRHPHELSPEVLEARFTAFRKGYSNWRKGGGKGAKGEVDDISAVN